MQARLLGRYALKDEPDRDLSKAIGLEEAGDAYPLNVLQQVVRIRTSSSSVGARPVAWCCHPSGRAKVTRKYAS